MTEHWVLDRGYIKNRSGDVLASVPYTLGDKADHARAQLIATTPELLDLVGKLAGALQLHHSGLDTMQSFRKTFDADEALLESARVFLKME